MFQDFILHCQSKGLSPKTIRIYTLGINRFLDFYSDDIFLVNKKVINDYIVYLINYDLSRYSINNYLRSLKVYFKYLDSEYSAALAKHIHFVKTPKLEKKIFSISELKTMFEYLDLTIQPLRNKIIFLLMYDSGLRLSEVVDLQTANIDLDNGIALIKGKGNKERYISLGQSLSALIRKYKGGKTYFLTTKQGYPLTQETIANLFRRMRAVTGIHVTPHLLRHNYATNFMIYQINSGSVDLYQLQMLMGHSDSSTTKIYLHAAQRMVAVKNSYSHFDYIEK